MIEALSSTSFRTKLVASLLAVYFIWGSTYLAIRFTVESLPPLTAAGARFLVAGLVLYAWARRKGAARPDAAAWRHEAVVGALLLLGGNGLVVWAASRVPSGLTALFVAIMPLWMVLLAALQERRPPTPRVTIGVLVGLVGTGLLVGGEGGQNADHVDVLAGFVLVLASFSWAVGSVWSRRRLPPAVPAISTAMQMLCGGALLVVVGVARGELAAFSVDDVTSRALLAWAYLCVFGSIIGFSAYGWLLRNATAASASTYAYVNPVVAVVLGWLLAGEPLTARMIVAAGIVVGAVAVITTTKR